MNNSTLCPFCFEPMTTSGNCPQCGHHVGEPSPGIQQLPVGWILDGKYRIGMTLGQGGFGITYLAYDLNLQQKVAIKEYFPSGLVARNSQIVTPFTQSGQSLYMKGVDSFYREAQLLARFQNHPNIVHIYNFFRENNTAYFVMEYVKGKSLSTYLDERGGRLSFDETISLLSPVMNALDELHQSGILHRDIAPDNIYLTENGTIKLLDFGAAKNELSQHTHSSAAILKPGYAPLEQYSVTGNQGPWTDVYAMGAVVYRCLSGMMPPDSPDRITGRECPPISSSGVKVSNQVETAIAKALSLSIPDRWQHMSDFKNALSDQNTKVSSAKSAYGYNVPIQQKSAEKKTKKNNSRIIFPSIIILSAFAAWLIIAVLIPAQKYNNAVNLMNEEKYTNAIDVFNELGGYKDAAEKITQCEEIIRDERYAQLLSMIETGNIDETMQVFEVLSEFQNDEARFNQAIALEASSLQTQNPENVAAILNKLDTNYTIRILGQMNFSSLVDIANVSELQLKEKILHANNALVQSTTPKDENFRIMAAFSEKGDVIRFGRYEQDNNNADGLEEIEWLIIDKNDTAIQLLSKYILDYQLFDKIHKSATWETCTLRVWLNDTFLNNAFSPEEQNYILKTLVGADKNPNFSANYGNSTRDRIYILGFLEVNDFFPEKMDRIAASTKYSESLTKEDMNNSWWLRSRGSFNNSSSYVNSYGIVHYLGQSNKLGIRPTLWLDFQVINPD